MLRTLTNKQLICMALMVSFLALSGISQAVSLSMMLDKNNSALTSSVHQMPCHQAEKDTVDLTVCEGCVDCHFCMLASTQIINTTIKTAFLNHVGLAYQPAYSTHTYSQDYPPAIRPPIV